MANFSRRDLLRITAVAVAGGATLALSGCQGAPEPVPSDDHAEDIGATVYVGENFYEPQLVTVKPGQAVTWEWVGKDRHDVVSSDRSFVSVLQTEGTYTHIFNDAGQFPYICSIHPEMKGVVVVE